MYAGIIKNDECVFLNLEQESVKKFNDFICINIFSGAESVVPVIAIYHSEDVEFVCFQGRDMNILIRELPSVRYISFSTDMAFIGKVEVDSTVSFQLFKFLQLLGLVGIELP